ncbi:hypothetical protein E2C01_025837 [Portunus trituberculatus]|uniref:Uncharacterized protein n=1 Tax=Portunus trituberculatus TaxID=210409 RepID=A0A5B7EJ11_PORTR|nr:hypothetical protein [Portunus trituberculatus]
MDDSASSTQNIKLYLLPPRSDSVVSESLLEDRKTFALYPLFSYSNECAGSCSPHSRVNAATGEAGNEVVVCGIGRAVLSTPVIRRLTPPHCRLSTASTGMLQTLMTLQELQKPN